MSDQSEPNSTVSAVPASVPNAPLVTRPEWNGGDCPTCKVKHPFDNVFCSDAYHFGEGQ